MKAYPRILKYSLPYSGYIILSIICHLLFAFFSLFTFGLIVPFASILFGISETVAVKPEFSPDINTAINLISYYITYFQGKYGMSYAIGFVSVLFLSSALFSNLFRFLGLYFLNPVNLNVSRDLKNELYHKVLTLPLSYYTNHRSGDIITRLNSDMREVNSVIKNSILLFSREPFQILVFVITLLMISPLLTLAAFIIFPLTAFLTSKISESIKRNSKKGQEQQSLINATYEESISGLRIIKGFNAYDFFKERFRQLILKYNKVTNKALRHIEFSACLAEITAIGGLCLVIFTGSNILFNSTNNLDVNTLILFVIIFAKLISLIQTGIKNISYIQRFMISVKRIFEVIDSDEVIKEKVDAMHIKEFNECIELKNVDFGYDEKHQVLKNFNLKIPKGKIIAIVGVSGSGKTTITNLVLRFYDVSRGQILVDGKDIKDYVISDIRGLFSLVSQEVILFHDSIYNNICFGLENVSMEKVKAAAKTANADEFISTMPAGYESMVGDRGTTLSGGQKQRISIARAILRNPQILILDEATASLDTKSEHAVQEALDRVMSGRTSLIIAHRLTTIRKADEIIVLDKGQIAERGTHAQLYKTDGLYRKWVNMQNVG